MPRDIPSIRILPMSDKTKGFHNRSIEQVQTDVFLNRLPARGGTFRYPSTGLNTEPGAIVLFQYRAKIIAAATFLRDEKFDHPHNGYAGALHFDPASFRTFHPLDVPAMRKIWPRFRAFGHVKQFLNPGQYSTFKKHLRHVQAPLSTTAGERPPQSRFASSRTTH